jgi:hypothetical protein
METGQKQPDSWDLWNDANSVKHCVCGKNTPSGYEWHAILHRREPDAWNSKYWWRRVGNHPVFAQLAGEAARLGWRAWDAVAFVDECEKERGSGSERETLLRSVQQREWELLFGWCFHAAAGKG